MSFGRKTRIVLWNAFVFLLLGAGITASIAWFEATKNTIEADVSGSVVEEYFHTEAPGDGFAGYEGDGSYAKPFVITRPIHYYHLVEFYQRTTRLPINQVDKVFGSEYLYFQVGYDFDHNPETPNQVYEYDANGLYTGNLSQELNMAYYSADNALLPIGTDEVPFIGSFDGGALQGIKITNLNIRRSEKVVIKDALGNESEVVRYASDIGVFGYVADKDGSDNATVIHDAFFDGITIDLTDVVLDQPVQPANSHVNEHDGVTNVGFVAGHVHSYVNKATQSMADSKPLCNVYVDHTQVLGGPNVRCDYGYLGKVDTIGGSMAPAISTAIDEMHGDGDTGWGGSIHMSGLYNRLNAYEDEYYSTYTGQGDISGKNYAGKLNAWVKTDLDRSFHYLAGTGGSIGSDQARLSSITYSVSSTENQNGFYISAGNNYLSLTDDGETIQTTSSPKNLWRFSEGSSGLLFTTTNATWQLSDNNTITRNGVVRFLAYVSGAIRVSSLTPDFLDSASWWRINGSNQIVRDADQTKVLCFNGIEWVIRNNGQANVGYKLYYGNPKLYVRVASANAYGMGYTADEATIFTFTPYGSGSNSGYKVGGTTPTGTVLRYFYYRNSEYLPYTTSIGTANTMMVYSGATGSTTVGLQNANAYLGQATGYRVKVDNNRLIRESGRAANASSYLRLEYVGETITPSSISALESVPKITWQIGGKVSDTETYIPLNVNENSLAATNQNVGYIVSGSNYSSNEGTANGDIRVSRYPYGDLFSSLSGTDVTVYTINQLDEDVVLGTIEDTLVIGDDATTSKAAETVSSYGFQKYYDYVLDDTPKTGARTAFYQSLTENKQYIYGLHFMNAAVSNLNKFSASDVRVNGTTYSSSNSEYYEFPRDSIDFHLKKDGIITFFAGTYFGVGYASSENNCFFSLSEVTRTGSTIDSIRLIYKIYQSKEDDSIVYTYNSSDTLSSDDYDLKFDTNWITDPSSSCWVNNAIYYFEIPVRDGEYALGSVNTNGKNGSYLMYLDIAANGNDGESEQEDFVKDVPLFTQIGFYTGAYFINSCFNIAYVVPEGSTKDTFSLYVSVSHVLVEGSTYTSYDLVITNTSGNDFILDALLIDDGLSGDYLYRYTIQYNGGSPAAYYGSDSYTGASEASSMVPAHPSEPS